MTQPLNKPYTALILDTQPDAVDELRAILSGDGWDVRLVSPDGESEGDLLRDVEDLEPEVILIGEMANQSPDGYALSALLRTVAPVLMLIGDATDAQFEHAYNCGATDIFSLPVHGVIVRGRLGVIADAQRQRLENTRLRQRAERTAEALRQSEERHRIISETISDYAYSYVVEEDGTFIKDWSTQPFHGITGYSFEEAGQDGWLKLLHSDDMPIAAERYMSLLAGEVDVSEFRIITKDGDTRWLRDHAHPVMDDALGRVVRIYGATQDITQRKQYEQQLQQQAEELRSRNEELDAFAYTVAHDLKNPIASMMGFASLIKNYFSKMPQEKVLESIDMIMESGYKLKEIINSLLLLAGVNKNDQVEISDLDMKIIVDDACRRLHALIEETHATLILPDQWPSVTGYGPWIEEVWMNYLSNAMKYGGEPPQIEIGAEPEDDMIRYYVRDNGNGLTDDERRRVFTPFTRLNQVKAEGHGLGLSIVQRIIHKLGGDVTVESQPGHGSIFSFTLPSFTS